MLVHVPGSNKETVKRTPGHEVYKAGIMFEESLAAPALEANEDGEPRRAALQHRPALMPALRAMHPQCTARAAE